MTDIDLQWLNDIGGLTVDGEVFGTIKVDGQDVQIALVRNRTGKPVAATFVPPGRHPLDPTQRPPIWNRDDVPPRDWADIPAIERLVHIVINAARIFVRAQVEGKWSSVALSELPDELKLSETRRLALRDVPPTMLIDEGDTPETGEDWFKKATLRRPDDSV